VSLPKFDLFEPKSVDKAISLKESMKDKGMFIAGGTDVIPQIRRRTLDPDALISLEHTDGLNEISVNNPVILGSMTRLHFIEKDPALRKRIPILCEAVDVLADVQIRNVATIGGNVCNAAPSADCAPALLVLEAKVKVDGPNGVREIPIEEFFLGPGETCLEENELLISISIPELRSETRFAFLKKGRVVQDIAKINAAVLLVMEGKRCRKCRIAVGAVAPVPLRLKAVEELMEGREIKESLLKKVQKETEQQVQPITDVRSNEEYRRIMSGVLTRQAILKALNP
jgi:carbon-monoxide dehydrogenase medium subunit